VFHVFMFYVGLLIVRLCFISDILLFIDLLSSIAASLFNKLTYLLTKEENVVSDAATLPFSSFYCSVHVTFKLGNSCDTL